MAKSNKPDVLGDMLRRGGPTLVKQDEEQAGPVTQLDPRIIAPNPRQPRRTADPDALAELVKSVKESGGIHEPLIVRPLPNGSYQLVAGGRRLAAALEVGLASVPVVVRDYTNEEAEQVALIENLQRADLSFEDEVEALGQLHKRYKKGAAIARVIGKSDDYVLLRLAVAEHPDVLQAYLDKRINMAEIMPTIRAKEKAAKEAAENPESFGIQESGEQGDDRARRFHLWRPYRTAVRRWQQTRVTDLADEDKAELLRIVDETQAELDRLRTELDD